MKFRSSQRLLPANGAFPAGIPLATKYSRIIDSASTKLFPESRSGNRPESVCICLTKSPIWAKAALGGLMTTSTPFPMGLRFSSVARTAISTRASVGRLRPVISQSTQISGTPSFIRSIYPAADQYENSPSVHLDVTKIGWGSPPSSEG